jgi:hypothetical protein
MRLGRSGIYERKCLQNKRDTYSADLVDLINNGAHG